MHGRAVITGGGRTVTLGSRVSAAARPRASTWAPIRAQIAVSDYPGCLPRCRSPPRDRRCRGCNRPALPLPRRTRGSRAATEVSRPGVLPASRPSPAGEFSSPLVLAKHRGVTYQISGVMYRITGHYPVAVPGRPWPPGIDGRCATVGPEARRLGRPGHRAARRGGSSASPMREAEDRLPFGNCWRCGRVWRDDARWRGCWRG